MRNPVLLLKRGFPVVQWLQEYSTEKGISDLVAGITIGLTLIPQVIAYAALAGLSPEYGLYSSLCGGLIYTIFGTTPELNIAPTALLSLLTFSYTHDAPFGNVPAAILLCFISGIVELLCGLLHLGFLLDFVSTPVVAAFTSAGAITIASAQVKNLLGLKFNAETFVDVWVNVFKHIKQVQIWDAVLGLGCCTLLLSLRYLMHYGSPPMSDKLEKPSLGKKLVWFMSVARNAFVVVGCALLAFVFECYTEVPFALTSKVPAGLPPVEPPPFEITTKNTTYTFTAMAKELNTGLIVVPFVAILGNVAIAKAFARGKVVAASQEMVAVGVCNIVGAFFSSFPVNASFSRAAVSNASGIRTPIGGIYTATMVFLALTFLTPYFSYIPKATLASVIICAVIFMVEVTLTRVIWNVHKIDLLPFIITFIACLGLGIEQGILVGVLVDVVMILFYTARPKIIVEQVLVDNGVEYTKIAPTAAILYPSAEYVREKVMRVNVESGRNTKVFVFDCSKMNRSDFTASKCVAALVDDLVKSGKTVIFFGIERKPAEVVLATCRQSCVILRNEHELQEYLRGNKEKCACQKPNGEAAGIYRELSTQL